MALAYRKKGEFVARTIAGETVLVPVRGQAGDLHSIYDLNEVGTFIWERIDGASTAAQVGAAVAKEFEISPLDAERDALRFIAELEAAGIVEPVSGSV